MENRQPLSKRARVDSLDSDAGNPSKTSEGDSDPRSEHADGESSGVEASDAKKKRCLKTDPASNDLPQAPSSDAGHHPPTEEAPDAGPSDNEARETASQEEESHERAPLDDPTDSYAPNNVQTAVYSNGDWQAVFDPASNAYYFANLKTGQTTWTNPMVAGADEPSSIPGPSQPSKSPDLGGIDPELAYLDPKMASALHHHSSADEPRFSARFHSKTGRFESDPSHDPARVSEFARSRKQAEAYFDVAGWEKSLQKHNGRVSGTSKQTTTNATRLSKAELNRFKQQKMEKKARNQRAWLTS